MARMRRNWKFDRLTKDTEKHVINAVDETMAHCVTMAKSLVRVDTATLQGSIRFKPATVQGNRVKGEWGSYGVNYALFQEIGPVSGVRTWAYTPYLRPSRDAEYPKLVKRIKERMGQ